MVEYVTATSLVGKLLVIGTSLKNIKGKDLSAIDDLDSVASKLVGLKIVDSSTQTKEAETTESSTQTEEFDYMFNTCSKEAPFDRQDMVDDDKVRFYTTSDCV